MSDTRASLTSETASRTVIAKEWLRRGLGEGLEYLDGVSIRRK